MDEQKRKRLEVTRQIRLFKKEAKLITLITEYAITEEGKRKFKSESETIRAFIMRGIRFEMKKLPRTKGRPQP